MRTLLCCALLMMSLAAVGQDATWKITTYEENEPFWNKPSADDHWLVIYWNPPHGCPPSNFAVFCESTSLGHTELVWFETKEAALKYMDATDSMILGLYETKTYKLEKTETEEHQKQPDLIVRKKHYKLAQGATQ